MHLIKFTICNTTINLYTDCERIVNKVNYEPRFILKTIPCSINYIGKVSKINDNHNSVIILNGKNNLINVDKDLNTFMVETVEQSFRFPDLVYMLLSSFSNGLKEEKVYLLHSAAVTNKDNNSVLLLGDPGSGKSTVAYNLIKNYGYKLISNDMTALKKENDKLKIVDGTKEMQMRLGALKLYFPEIIKELDIDDKGQNEWDIKPYVNNTFTSSELCNDNYIKVNGIYKLATSSSMEFSMREEDYIDKKLYIYEQLIKQLKNNRNYIAGFNYPTESFETKESSKDVSDLSEFIVNNVDMVEIRGTIDEVSKNLVRRNEK